jgi:hypothetical protein
MLIICNVTSIGRFGTILEKIGMPLEVLALFSLFFWSLTWSSAIAHSLDSGGDSFCSSGRQSYSSPYQPASSQSFATSSSSNSRSLARPK